MIDKQPIESPVLPVQALELDPDKVWVFFIDNPAENAIRDEIDTMIEHFTKELGKEIHALILPLDMRVTTMDIEDVELMLVSWRARQQAEMLQYSVNKDIVPNESGC